MRLHRRHNTSVTGSSPFLYTVLSLRGHSAHSPEAMDFPEYALSLGTTRLIYLHQLCPLYLIIPPILVWA